MPVFSLDEEFGFPDPGLAEPDGLLAVGGDLQPERLVNAYAMGIFPWYDDSSPILWWSPDPRLILLPDKFKLTKSLEQSVRVSNFRFSADKDFEHVIHECAGISRVDAGGTWIIPEMAKAYQKLHSLGLAHSVEVWQGDELVGGLYGVSLGAAFFGESMFFRQRDASKAALWKLCQFLHYHNFHFIDAQVRTDHLIRMGAIEKPREEFLELLDQSLEQPTMQCKWTSAFDAFLLQNL